MPQFPPQGHLPPGEPEDLYLRYYPNDTQVQTYVPAARRETSFSSLSLSVWIPLPFAVCDVLVLNIPSYITGSLATNAWRTRAIEHAIGAGCVGTVTFVLFLVQKHRFARTVCQWKRAVGDLLGWSGDELETAFLHASTVILFPIVPGLGHAIRSLASEPTREGLALLSNAIFGFVPAIWMVYVVHWCTSLIAPAFPIC